MFQKKVEENQKRDLRSRSITQDLTINKRTNELTIAKIIAEEMIKATEIRLLTLDDDVITPPS